MLKRRFLFFLGVLLGGVLIFSPLPALAADNAAAFLEMGEGAKALGMGGAFVAIADDGSAPLWNPAGISRAKESITSATYSDKFNVGIKSGFLSFVRSSYGISLYRISVDDIPRTVWGPDSSPQKIGSFSDEENALFLSFAFKYAPRLYLGINGKYIYQKLYNREASGLGVDLGAIFQATDSLSLGLTIQNIGGSWLKWNTSSSHTDKIMQNIKAGFSLSLLNNNLTLAVDVDNKKDDYLFHTGVDLHLSSSLSLRMGSFQYSPRDKIGEILTGGLGINVGKMQFDYAYVPHSLGATHKFSLQTKF
ncbi:MAG: PorV/PorQ family protein [Candidatus Aerophobetes bacterium]|nr:PorV/PorQ family protein [Candidatus Aerophobetes bacterium]